MRVVCCIGLVAFVACKAISASANPIVGQVTGNFDVSGDGNSAYVIVLEVPPGTAGMVPNLSLSYSSHGSSSVIGPGWSIQGLKFISRGPRNIEIDGYVSGVNWSRNDAFYYGGARLVPVDSNDDYIEYRTAVDDGSRIRAYGWDDYGPSTFVVETGDGIVWHFGGKENAVVQISGRTLIWLADRANDSTGNYMTFTYSQNGEGDYQLRKAQYSGHFSTNQAPYASISFEYDDVRPIEGYLAGFKFSRSKRLKSIESKYNEDLMYRYDLAYEDVKSGARYRLQSVTQSGRDGGMLPPTKFEYANASPLWMTAQGWSTELPAFSGQMQIVAGTRVLDVNADGFADFVHASYSGGELLSRTILGTKSGWHATETDTFASPIGFADELGPRPGIRIVDLNGDGYQEILEYREIGGSTKRRSFIGTSSGWRPSKELTLPRPLAIGDATVPGVFFEDIDQDGDLDLVYGGDVNTGISPQTYFFESETWVIAQNASLPRPLTIENGRPIGFYFLDVECDKKLEIVYHHMSADESDVDVTEIFTFADGAWQRVEGDQFILPFSPTIDRRSVKLMYVDDDSCVDLAVSFESNDGSVQGVWTATENGWTLATGLAPPEYFYKEGSEFESDIRIADINGDKRDDLAWNFQERETQYVGTFLNLPSGWTKSELLELPRPTSKGSSTNSIAELVDLNADGKDDVIYMADLVEPNDSAYVSLGYEWVGKSEFNPPLAFAKQQEVDLGVRFVDLNADGLPDILVHREGSSDAATSFVNNGSGWEKDAAYDPKEFYFVSGENGVDVGTRVIDINADGLADFLYARTTDQESVSGVHLNSGSGWIREPDQIQLPSDVVFADSTSGDLGVQLTDLNRDGLIDILVSRRDGQHETTRAAYLRTDDKWESAPEFVPCVDLEEGVEATRFCVDFVSKDMVSSISGPQRLSDKYRKLGVLLTDVTGDGLPDLVFNHTLTLGAPRSRHDLGCVESTCPESPPREAYSQQNRGALINTGAGWRLDEAHGSPVALDIAGVNTATNFVEDVNGDGLVDIVSVSHSRRTASARIYLNTGRSFVDGTAHWGFPAGTVAAELGDPGFRFLDVNGDGLLDILYSRKRSNGALEKATYLNSGFGWETTNAYDGAVPDALITDYTVGDIGSRIVDADGDGRPDLIRSYVGENGAVDKQILLNRGTDYYRSRRADVMTRVHEGYGNSIEVEYRPITLNGGWITRNGRPTTRFYEPKQSEFPSISPPLPMNPVRNVSFVTSGRSTSGNKVQTAAVSYRYSGFRVNVLSGQPYGFETRESIDSYSGWTSIVTFYQDSWRSGLMKSEQRRRAGREHAVGLTRYDWTVYAVRDENDLGREGPSYRVTRLTRLEEEKSDLSGNLVSSQSTEFEYRVSDNYFNVHAIRTTRSDGKWSTTKNEYRDNLGNWFRGRLTRVETILGKTNSPNINRISEFKYSETTGLLELEITGVGTKYSRSEFRIYDEYGNTTSRLACGTPMEDQESVFVHVGDTQFECLGGDDNLPRVFETVYSSDGRLVDYEVNAAGHLKAVERYDDVFGLPTSVLDANRLLTSMDYDEFGRTRSIVAPSGVTSRFEYEWISHNELGGIYGIRSSTEGLTDTLEWYDGNDRRVRQVSIGNDGRQILTDIKYDVLDRVEWRTDPYFLGDSPPKTTLDYDEIDRVTKVVRPSGQAACYFYRGLTTEIVDLYGPAERVLNPPVNDDSYCDIVNASDNKFVRRRSESFTLDNNVELTRDAAGAEVYYEYDAAGNLTYIRNADKSETHISYHSMGFRRMLQDPNLGTREYDYNVYGELVKQVDSEHNVTEFKYDTLGRLTERIEPGYKSTFEFDIGDYAVGRKSRVLDTEGYVESYEYDSFSRPYRTTTRIHGKEYETSIHFDSYGRVRKLTYPSGMSVTNHYDEFGLLECVAPAATKDCASSSFYWKAIEYTARGQVRLQRFGNGVVSVEGYDPLGNVVSSIRSTSSGGGVLLDESYQFDRAGNIEARFVAGQLTQRYEYDELDRLTTTIGKFSSRRNFRYDSVGNIRSKPGIQSLDYEHDFPAHAISSVTINNEVSEYEYDSNGNQTAGPYGDISYDSAGNPVRLQHSRLRRSIFEYTPDGSRYWHDYRNGLTRVRTTYVGAYEVVHEEMTEPLMPTSERIRKRHHIAGASGIVAVVEEITWLFPVRRLPSSLRSVVPSQPDRSSITTQSTMYFHRDRLGSLRVISDEHGEVFDSFEFDEFGARIETDLSRRYHTFSSGFAFQEYLDNLDLIHMNGRIYDPLVGRFLSPDPYLEFPHSAQGLNRFIYALNNPIRYVDPTGYGLIDDLLKDVVGGALGGVVEIVSPVFEEFGRFMNKHGRTVIPIVAGVLVSTINPVAGAAVMGFTSAAVHGASFEESLRAAAISAAVAYVMGGVSRHTRDWSSHSRFAAQGAAGGAMAKVRGGDFETGFFSAGITSLTPPLANHGDIDFHDLAVRATVGGTVATIGGGKFENGATVAAFSYMFARLAAPKPAPMESGKIYVTQRRVGKAGPVHLAINWGAEGRQALGAGAHGLTLEGAEQLQAEFPRSEDNPNNAFGNVLLAEIVPPDGIAPTEYINLLTYYADTYSPQDYDLFPGISDGYNSNSFVRGLIESTGGATTVDFSNFVGGGKPVPKSAFGNSR